MTTHGGRVAVVHHRCPTAHRTWAAAARCQWKRAVWVTGEGCWGVHAPCGHGATITLHADYYAAADALGFIDRLGCGHSCQPRTHVLFQMDKITTGRPR